MKRSFIIALIALIAALCAGAASAASITAGGFILTSDSALTHGTDHTYESGGTTYALQGWGVGSFTKNGVLTILKGGKYTISMAGSGPTTDRIKIAPGIEVDLTIKDLNIAPNQTDGYSDHYGEGRPFDMKGATVHLTLVGTNTFTAPAFSTALFCPDKSKLTIGGSGTLNAITDSEFCVAGIGGEGKVRKDYTYEGYHGTSGGKTIYPITSGHEQLARFRDWPNDDDSKCGDITINAPATVLAECRSGLNDWTTGGYYEQDAIEYTRDVGSDTFATPVVRQSTTFGLLNCVVGIGGGYSGNITINGGSVTARGAIASIGIGSTTKDFGKVEINGGVVNAQSGWKTKIGEGIGGAGAVMDFTGADNFGPAIGWVKYGGFSPSNMVIRINGGEVNAKGGYGGAGIGGGETDKGLVIITGGDVTATGGDDAAGIGGGCCRTANSDSGHSGTIIIAGDSKVTATGGKNAPGIGSGAADNGNPNPYGGKVQAIVITTTGEVEANAGSGAVSNIGPGVLKDPASGPANDNSGSRFVGPYINTSNAAQTGTLDPTTITNSLVKSGSDLALKGTVDLTRFDYVGRYTPADEDIVSRSVADILSGSATITSAAGGAGSKPELKISTDHITQAIKKKIPDTVTVIGVDITRWTITVTAGSGGTVTGPTGPVRDGAPVTIAATPNAGYVFTRWEEGGRSIGTSTTLSFTADRDRTIGAVFSPVRTDGEGGGKLDPSSALERLKGALRALPSTDPIHGRIDVSGPNAFAFRADDSLAAVNSTKHDASSAESFSVPRGETFSIEIFCFAGSTDALDASAAGALTMEIASGGRVAASQTETLKDGYAAFTIATSSLRSVSTAEEIKARTAEAFVASIKDPSGDISLIMPFVVISGDGSEDSSSGGASCASGAAAAAALAALALRRRRR